MPQPRIGISTERDWNGANRIVGITGSYTQAVLRAGGVPVLLPVQLTVEEIEALLPTLQGVLFTGGPDVHPALFQAPMHPSVKGIDPARDQTDLYLLRTAVRMRIPVLAICRGFQVLNVAFGGSLYTDLSSDRPDGLFHTCYPNLPYDLLSHSVRLEPGSRLAGLLACDELYVNSLHHQGVNRPGEGLQVAARANDGLIEALEILDYPFGVGVQWHPELLPQDGPSQGLFQAFIRAAAAKR